MHNNRCYYLLGKEGYVFGSVGLSVCLFVCLFVCLWTTLYLFLVALVCLSVYLWTLLKSYERIGMKFYGQVLGSKMKN